MALLLELNQYSAYLRLMRLDKPVGIFLLLWPTLWALWLGADGHPRLDIVVIFVLGVILMRSAGCIANDLMDRRFDWQVERTRSRPLVTGEVSSLGAMVLCCFLSFSAFGLVLLCNSTTIQFACIGMGWVLIYPFLKRVTVFPQLGLGIAFSWGIPMAFVAENGTVPFSAWFLFLTSLLWPVIYDTFYAMVDRAEDIQAGVKSTAIVFGQYTLEIIAALQMTFLLFLVVIGYLFHLHFFYYVGLFISGVFFIYQLWLIQDHHREQCFKAFLNNQWVGFVIFIGIVLGTHT